MCDIRENFGNFHTVRAKVALMQQLQTFHLKLIKALVKEER